MAARTLGKYTMLETLGQGGFSKVRLGIDPATGDKVALKILKKKEMGCTADVIKQVEREISAMSLINHPNVIRLREVNWHATYTKKNGTQLDVILVVLELASGGELFDFLAFTGPFEETLARTYFQQLMSGIAHCHEKGIAHRDLKPENLLLDSNFILKIADFGFANSFNTLNKTTMYTECGTPGYMAPELLGSKNANSRGYEGAAADIWSCGVVLFISVAGFPPFQRPQLNDWWFNKLANGKHHLFWEAHQRTAYFSDTLKDFINKILNPDVTKRMRIDELQRHPWFRGPTISHSALNAELTRRKATVDESKNRERAEKVAKQLIESGAASGGVLNDGVLTRGDGSLDFSSESLPALVPSIAAFGRGGLAAPKFLAVPKAQAVMSADAFGAQDGDEDEAETYDNKHPSASSSAASAVSAEAPPAFTSTLTSFTRFSCIPSLNAAALLARISRELVAVGCTIQAGASASLFKLKRVKCVQSGGVVEFQVALYSSDEGIMVDFKKLSQDSVMFRELFSDVRERLEDIIIKTVVAEE